MKQKMGILSLAMSAAGWIIFWAAISQHVDLANVTAGDVNVFVIGTAVIPSVLGLAAVILGIRSIVKKSGFRVAAIIGILLALPLIMWGGMIAVGYMRGISPEELLRAFTEGAEGAL